MLDIWCENIDSKISRIPSEDEINGLYESMCGKNLLRKKYIIPRYTKSVFQNVIVIVTDHAHERWNQRVGPYISKEDLSELFFHLLNLKRVNFHGMDYGYIDNEILFVFERLNENYISIITFYGRVSYNIALQNFKYIKRYVRYSDDSLLLDIPKEKLNKQNIPAIPYKIERKYDGYSKIETAWFRTETKKLVIHTEQLENSTTIKLKEASCLTLDR